MNKLTRLNHLPGSLINDSSNINNNHGYNHTSENKKDNILI